MKNTKCGMRNALRFFTVLGLMLIAAACATARRPSAPAEQDPLADLAWMAGKWTAAGEDGMRAEEYWTEPGGGVMVGVHRDLKPDGTVFFEFLILEARGSVIVYSAQPKGSPPTEFRLTEHGPDRAVFENPAHDFPQRITYRLDGRRLCAEISGVSRGVEMKSGWCWQGTGRSR